MDNLQTIDEVESKVWIRAYLRALDCHEPADAEDFAEDAVRRFQNWRLRVSDDPLDEDG